MAGMRGNNRASPRLSASAISASWDTAMAASLFARDENITPAMAVPAKHVLAFSLVRAFGMETFEGVTFVLLCNFGEFVVLMHMHMYLVLIIAIVAAITELEGVSSRGTKL